MIRKGFDCVGFDRHGEVEKQSTTEGTAAAKALRQGQDRSVPGSKSVWLKCRAKGSVCPM